jgi:hypothetical protein
MSCPDAATWCITYLLQARLSRQVSEVAQVGGLPASRLDPEQWEQLGKRLTRLEMLVESVPQVGGWAGGWAGELPGMCDHTAALHWEAGLDPGQLVDPSCRPGAHLTTWHVANRASESGLQPVSHRRRVA